MATFAARRLQPMIANVAHILGIEWLAAAQGIEFLRPLASFAPLEAAHALLRQHVPGTPDRPGGGAGQDRARRSTSRSRSSSAPRR
jgi:histidine ammonia-lyase